MGLGDLIDKAASALGGGDKGGAAAPKAKGTPVYTQGIALHVETQDPAATAPQNINALDQGPIEFIHFGRVHADVNNCYVHEKLKDTDNKFPEGVEHPGRAYMFRAALERETLLLHGYVSACQKVMQEYKDNAGGVGELVGMASSMLMGEQKEAKKPEPKDLDEHKKDIESAGGSVNVDQIKYKDVHKAGKDLHQFRSDFNKFGEDVYKQMVKKESGPTGGGLGGLLPEIPGVPGGAKLVTGILFKAFDIYLAMYLKLRTKYEKPIEDVCYDLSIKAITEPHAPVYPIWFPKPKEPEEDGSAGGGGGMLSGITDKVDEAKKTAGDAADKVKSFLGFEEAPEPTFGDEAFDKVFASMAPHIANGAPDSAAITFLDGFRDALGVSSLPKFVNTIVDEITAVNTALLKRVYKAIQLGSASAAIDEPGMQKIGSEELSRQLVGIAFKLIGGLIGVEPDAKLVGAQGMDITGKNLQNIASKYMDQGLGGQLERVVQLTMKSLAAELEAVRSDAAKNKHATMEVFYGRLPWLLSLQVRNTFFPVWELVVKAVFGNAGGPALAAVSPMKSMLGKAGDVAKDVKEAKDTAERVKDKLSSGVDLISAASDPEKFAKGLTDGGAGPAAAGAAAGGAKFPGSARLDSGVGVAITLAEWKDVKDNQKVEVKAA